MDKKIKKAVIPAAGFGTRFLPITKAISKEMLPIVDIPTIQIIVEEAIEAGISEILIIVNEDKKDIINYFSCNKKFEKFLLDKGKDNLLVKLRESEKMCNITFTYQNEQKGLGHAILMAKDFVDGEDFAVLLGDDIVVNKDNGATKQLIDLYNKYNCTILGVQTVEAADVNKYGIISYSNFQGREYKVIGMVEKPNFEAAPSNVAILGRYILTNSIFAYLEKQKPGFGGEIQLTDSIFSLLEKESIYAYDFEGKRYDVGDRFGYFKAIIDFALTREDIGKEAKNYLRKINEEE
ncbi:MAG: UTP--glucose-1-phosphate uridylyltransferase GalU [Bacilli bacterium]|nr:UTP--glucose-1-phosphate uridylyltransferase GalU [Bacilli bacterium]